jgi:hypothetical protein
LLGELLVSTRDLFSGAREQMHDRLVLVSLENIQEHLENPFDQIGQDDVSINAEKFVDWLQAGAADQTA